MPKAAKSSAASAFPSRPISSRVQTNSRFRYCRQSQRMLAKTSTSALAIILTVVTGAVESDASTQPDIGGAPPTFRSGTSLVVITATVQDSGGSYVRGLTASDFSVYEEGVRQN